MFKLLNLAEIKKSSRLIWLPAALSLLFVIQNQAYNSWLNIYPDQYFWRRFFVTLALGVILYGPALFFKRRGRYLYLLIISVLIAVTFIAQFVYFEYASAFLQVSALKYAPNAATEINTIITLLNWRLWLFIAGPLLVALELIINRHYKFSFNPLNQREKTVVTLFIVLIAFGGYYFLVHNETKEWGDDSRLYEDVYDLDTLVAKVGIINFTLEDACKYLTRANQPTASDLVFLNSWEKSRITAATTTPKYFGLAKKRNIIIIQVESLEAAVIGQSLGGQEITPNLNKLAKTGLYFNNYYTQIGPGNTADAEFVTMDSLFPLPDDVAFIDYAQNSYRALPQLLEQNGYHTYALHGDVPTFWNRSNIYPQLGYGHWFSKQDYTINRVIGPGFAELGDEDFLQQSIAKLQGLPQPFLATVITISSHTPFQIPADLQTLTIPTDVQLTATQHDYLESLHYVDQAIGDFIAGLKTAGLYDNSVIFIYGDHESFTSISKALGTDRQTLPGISDSQVPLLILAPGLNLQGVNNTPSSHLDLYPTITNLLGLATPTSVLGQDILNSAHPVITRRNSGSGTINTILTPNLAYEASTSGLFEQGNCLAMPSRASLSSQDCLALYNQQNDLIKVSDIVERSNLILTLH
jgi:phosphoglycerol transferase MdoB-like AlkP superfamily enzyme